MNAHARFSDSDIEALKDAKAALHGIYCWPVPCNICPLHIKDRGCLINELGYLIRKAESEKGCNYGSGSIII